MLKILIMLMLLASPALAEWDANIPLAADNLTDFPVDNQENLDRLELVLREYAKGITLSYSSGGTIVASTGGVVCSDAAGTTKKFRGNTSTTNITFADIDTGAEAGSTTYYVYANCDAVATTATFKISLSSTTPTGLTSYKRIGSFYNDSSSNITTIDNDAVSGEFNTLSSKSVGSTYQATTQGFACGQIVTAGSGTSGYITGYTDNASTPTTVLGYASAIENSQADHSTTRNSFCMPVKAGDYYRIIQTTWAGASSGGTATMYFLSTN